jgi:cell division protein FtsQ
MKSRDPAPLLSTATMQAAAALMIGASLLLLLGGAASWVVQRPWFDLHRIELRAADGRSPAHVTVASVRAATLGRLSGNFFTMRLDDTRRVFESVPWVASVSLRRVWPDRLVVTVTEHRVIAVWDDGRLLSDRGVLFVANVAEAELDGALPRVEAPPRFSREVARRLPQLTSQAAALGFDIEAVDVSDRASWTLRTAGGPAIELGRDEPPGRLDERLALLVSQYPTVSAHVGNEILRIDTRYPQGFAVAAASRKP